MTTPQAPETDDLNKLTKALATLEVDTGGFKDRPNFGWGCPALNVLDCVLSLRTNYNRVVLPRIRAFATACPHVRDLADLQEQMSRCESPLDFFQRELNFNSARKSEIVAGVTSYLLTIQKAYDGATEYERLAAWAQSAEPHEAYQVGVHGFGLAGFQYLRMLFGAQTTKPDMHIRAFVAKIIGRPVTDWEAMTLLDKAAQVGGFPLRDVDGAIWKEATQT